VGNAQREARLQSGKVRRKEPPDRPGLDIDPWFHGFACALAEVWRLHHDGQMVGHILTASGITYTSLVHAGCDELDLESIRQAIERRASCRERGEG
jgi:hypothetical protein